LTRFFPAYKGYLWYAYCLFTYHTDFTCRLLFRLGPSPAEAIPHHEAPPNNPTLQSGVLTYSPHSPIIQDTSSHSDSLSNSTQFLFTQDDIPPASGSIFNTSSTVAPPRPSIPSTSFSTSTLPPFLRQSLPPSTPTIQRRPSTFSFQSANHEFPQQTSALQPRLTSVLCISRLTSHITIIRKGTRRSGN
jgi:hypothetical protein